MGGRADSSSSSSASSSASVPDPAAARATRHYVMSAEQGSLLAERLAEREAEADDLISLVDGVVSADSAQLRRERAMAALAHRDQASLAGVLLDLAETATSIGIELASGSAHIGVVEEISAGAAQLRTRSANVVVFPLDAVIGVATGSLRRPPTGDRAVPPGDLAARLGDLCATQPSVRIGRASGSPSVVGRLLAVGADIVTVRSDDGRLAVIPLRAITEVVVS